MHPSCDLSMLRNEQPHVGRSVGCMNNKSTAIVSFLANLMPLYTHEGRAGVWCARSLQDGTLILPVDESDWDEESGSVRVLQAIAAAAVPR